MVMSMYVYVVWGYVILKNELRPIGPNQPASQPTTQHHTPANPPTPKTPTPTQHSTRTNAPQRRRQRRALPHPLVAVEEDAPVHEPQRHQVPARVHGEAEHLGVSLQLQQLCVSSGWDCGGWNGMGMIVSCDKSHTSHPHPHQQSPSISLKGKTHTCGTGSSSAMGAVLLWLWLC